MPTISKSKLKANMLRVFREIEASGEELIVTDRNRPVLSIRPIASGISVEEAFASGAASWSSTKTQTPNH